MTVLMSSQYKIHVRMSRGSQYVMRDNYQITFVFLCYAVQWESSLPVPTRSPAHLCVSRQGQATAQQETRWALNDCEMLVISTWAHLLINVQLTPLSFSLCSVGSSSKYIERQGSSIIDIDGLIKFQC